MPRSDRSASSCARDRSALDLSHEGLRTYSCVVGLFVLAKRKINCLVSESIFVVVKKPWLSYTKTLKLKTLTLRKGLAQEKNKREQHPARLIAESSLRSSISGIHSMAARGFAANGSTIASLLYVISSCCSSKRGSYSVFFGYCFPPFIISLLSSYIPIILFFTIVNHKSIERFILKIKTFSL